MNLRTNFFKFTFTIAFILLGLLYLDYSYNISNLIVEWASSEQQLERRGYVAISTNLQTDKEYYIFYLPIVCEAWRRVGYEPILILVIDDLNNVNVNLNSSTNLRDDEHDNEKVIEARLNRLQIKVLEKLKELNVKLYYMRSFRNYEVQLGMLARIFIGFVGSEYIPDPNALIILSDTDLIPIRRGYYQPVRNGITVWNAFCCGKFIYKNVSYQEYPMSHVGMRKYEWMQILMFDSRSDRFYFESNRTTNIRINRLSIVRLINEFYGENRFMMNNQIAQGDRTWSTDQQMTSILIEKYTRQHSKHLKKKAYEGVRLDRSFSYFKWMMAALFYFHALTDSHCYHGSMLTNIGALRALNRKLFNDQRRHHLNQYFDDYISIHSSNYSNSFTRVTLKNL